MSKPFWQTKKLIEMSSAEWESLCDGCAKCCLVKIEDEDSAKVFYTRLHCKLLNQDTCQCSDYSNRLQRVSDCFQLTPENLNDIDWLPSSCAYRRLNEGKLLPGWHPLVTGNKDSVHQSGNSVRGRVLSERFAHPEEVEEHIINWVD